MRALVTGGTGFIGRRLVRLLDWLAGVSRGTRIVYASSVAVHDRVAEPKGPIVETSPLTPRTGHGPPGSARRHSESRAGAREMDRVEPHG